MLAEAEDDDPMSVVSNLFDVAMVFALALMVALVSRYNMTEMFSQEDFTMVKNPGKDNMEIITKEGQKINRYTPSDDQSILMRAFSSASRNAYRASISSSTILPWYFGRLRGLRGCG